jgi:hypothetical protein
LTRGSDPFGSDRRHLEPIPPPNPLASREERVKRFVASLEKAQPQRRAARQPNYSTQYARSLCKERGWRIQQSEYRDRFNNLRDCPAGSDVVALRQDRTQVYVQAGCPGSKAEHYRRFEERKRELPIGTTFLYWEFHRDGTLVLEEEWE